MSVAAVVRKEFRQISRDRRTLGVIVFVPVFLLMMFGYAVSLDVRNAPIAIVDLERSRQSRELVALFQHNGDYFDVRYFPTDPLDIKRLLLEGDIQGGVVIPEGAFPLGADEAGAPAIQVVVDGTNGTIASALQGYINSIIVEYSTNGAMHNGAMPVALVPRVWFNPELESNRYLVPGLVAFILVITAVISTALSIVREKELGTFEQIAASPLRPVDLIIGKTLPYFAISAVIAGGVFLAGYLLFGVSVRGSIAWLAFVTTLFLFASLGLGIFISSISDTQQVAFMVSILVTFLPAFILSGFIFPIANMPPIIQAVTYAIPARYYIAALRTIMLKGGGIDLFWHDALFLTIFAVITIGAGVVRLRARSVSG